MNDGRLDSLNTDSRERTVNRGYTAFIKSIRFILPVGALLLITTVLLWPEMENKVVIVPKEEIMTQTNTQIGQNELLNPKFETVDAQQQPVNVTAMRALQNQENPNLIKLENPNANLQTKDGSKIHIEAINGTYEQETEKLFLQDNVKVRHETGYELQAKELRVNMKTREAFSDQEVRVDGPKARIDAAGLDGNVENGILVFKGPAKLTLKPTSEEETNE